VPPLLPPPEAQGLDPKVALEIAKAGQEMLRRDFYSAAFIFMGVAILLLAAWVVWLQRHLSAVRDALQAQLTTVQNQRVADHVDGERRARELAERMAVHMDRATEATVMMLAKKGKPG